MPTHAPDAPDPRSPPLRARLIDEAMVLLEREGAEAITLRSLAAAVGVSHMAPYRHFRDKEALLAALAERGFVALGTAMQAAGARRAAAGAAPREAFLGFGLAYLAFARARPQLYRLMFGPALAGKPGHAGLQAAGEATYAGLSQAVGAVLAPQGVTAEDANTHAVTTWALVHGLAMLLLDGRLKVAPDSAEETALVEHVLRVHGRSFRAFDPPL
jgi:AcrR family transcriptional regulator